MNAPGRPTTTTFFPAVYSAMLTFSGGNPESISMEGILVPGVMAENAAAPVAINATANVEINFMMSIVDQIEITKRIRFVISSSVDQDRLPTRWMSSDLLSAVGGQHVDLVVQVSSTSFCDVSMLK